MGCGIKILLVLLIVSPQIAAAGLFDILNEEYIDNINDLPYSEGTPLINWIYSPGNIDYRWAKAWIDITGFKDMVNVNGLFYVKDNPVDHAIVRFGYKGLRGETVSWSPTIRKYQSGDHVIAELTIERKWTEIFCGEDSCYPVHYSATMTITDSEVSPLIYQSIYDGSVKIVEYNNTIEQKIAIQVREPNASKVSIRYGNGSVTHTLKSYHVERTEKGIYYANITPLDTWEVQGQDIGRFGNSVLINTNISEMNYSKIEIIVSDIYGTTRVNPAEFNITTLTYEPEKIVFNPVLIVFLGIVGTALFYSSYIINRIQL